MSDTVNPLVPAAYDVIWSITAVGVLLLMVIALVSISRTAKRITSWQALIWALVVIFVPLVGPLSWLFIGRRSATPSEEMAELAPRDR